MSAEVPAEPWPVLDSLERRVLGVLIEKAKTTPDVYPMSINSLVTGSNQKSNRDPVMNLSDEQVEDALARCQKRGYVMRVTSSSRVERWRHMFHENLKLTNPEAAIIAELLLRGPQTEGELRGRANRMAPIEDLDTLRTVLRGMVERKLVVYLTPEERRGAMVTHGFHDPRELDRLRVLHVDRAELPEVALAAPSRPAASLPAAPQVIPGMDELKTEVAALKQLTADLQGNLAAVSDEVQRIKQALGL